MSQRTLIGSILISALVYFSLTSVGLGASPNRRALLIGIDEYRSPQVSDLSGTVNDVMLMRNVLIGKFDVPEENIKLLKNEEATHEGIVNAIRTHLIAKAAPGDVIILHYSGHGSQMKDASGDEVDGLDETIVPHDSRTEGVFDISDDEINGLLRELTQKTKNVTVILDSCHSGAGLRGGNTVRAIPADDRPPPPAPAYALSQRGASEGSDGISLSGSDYVLISGSRADQLSNESQFEGRRHGALTYFLAGALRATDSSTTYEDVMDSVKANVLSRYASQEPQLEGEGTDLVVFGIDRIEARPYVLVNPLSSGRVKVDAGKVYGVRKGTTFEVYPPQTRDFGKVQPIATIEVDQADDFSSTAEIKQGNEIQPLSRAVVEAATFGDTSIPVHVASATTGVLSQIKDGLEGSTTLRFVDNENDARIIVREEDGQVQILSGDLENFVPAVSSSKPGAANEVIDKVKDLTHWLTVLELNNPASTLNISFTIRRKDDPTDAGPPKAVLEKTHITYQVKNNGDEPVYLTVLDVSSAGSIELLYPRGGEQQALPPGEALEKDIEVFVNEGHDSVVDTLKVIATSRPINPTVFPQGSIKSAALLRGAEDDPLTRFLDDAMRTSLRGSKPVNVDTWTTRQQTLRIRRGTSTLSGFSLYFDDPREKQDLEEMLADSRSICPQDEIEPSCARVVSTSKDGTTFDLAGSKSVSPGRAFDEAYELQDETKAARVEPNLDVRLPGVVTERGIEKRGLPGDDLHDPLADKDHLWSLKQIRVFDAWKKIRESNGSNEGVEAAGILIAHPDTGYREHPELWTEVRGKRPIDVAKGYNFYEGTSDARDPLLSDRPLDTPGHGTASGSVIVSPSGCQMPNKDKCADGIARGAQLIPLRVHRTVAQFNAKNLAEAIRAVAEGRIEGKPKLISIAMGGPPSYGLWKAVKEAEKVGVLIVAASGNYVRTVVWPARFPSTIAVAAHNVRCKSWKHSSRGESVDVSAPGESVWRASINDKHEYIVGMSKGTTFATGNVAGAAALWLAFHRDDPILDELQRRGAVTRVFQRVLRNSVWRPDVVAGHPNGTYCDKSRWDDRYGPGILDVAALLEQPLADSGVAEAGTERSLDPLPLFSSLYPADTQRDRVVEDYMAIFGRDDVGKLDDLARFEMEMLHHYTLNDDVREAVDRMIASSGKSGADAVEPIRRRLRETDISNRLRQALTPPN